MRKTLLLSLFLAGTIAGYSQNGFGIRLGDPTGITFKKYSGDNALELSIGRFGQAGDGFYNNQFYAWYNDETFGYTDVKYLGFERSMPLGIHLHYLIHQDWFASEFDGLQWYYGFGGQLRLQTFTFQYQYKVEGDPRWHNVEDQKVTDLDLGGDGVLGAEYEFQDAPIRAFIDVTLFMEIVDNPFYFWFQYGIGARYMF